MLPVIIMIPFIIFGLCTDINNIISNEASRENIGFVFIMLICLIFSLAMIVPSFRSIFKKLPWLYAYTLIALLDILLISIGILIINYGYEVKNEHRHFLFLTFMIFWMIIGRLSMCFYYKFKPMKYEGDEDDE
jgi:nitrate reductase NapE component